MGTAGVGFALDIYGDVRDVPKGKADNPYIRDLDLTVTGLDGAAFAVAWFVA